MCENHDFPLTVHLHIKSLEKLVKSEEELWLALIHLVKRNGSYDYINDASDGRYRIFASATVIKGNRTLTKLSLGIDTNPTLLGGHVLSFGSVGFYNALKDPNGDGRKTLKAALEYLQE